MVVQAFGGLVARTAAQGAGASVRTVGAGSAVRGATNISSTVSGVAGSTVGQGRSGKSSILDSKGNPIITPAKTGVAPAGGGASLEQSRESNALQDRMINLLEAIEANTSGKGQDVASTKPQQTLMESVMSTLGGMISGIGGLLTGLGIFKGFKDAAAAKERGESEFGIFAEFVKGTIKGILNIPFNIVDNILNLFDIDIPDNMGDLIVEGAIKMVKDLADYIKNLPDRIMKAITGMIENIGIPEFKIFGKSFGPYYPFRGDGEVKQEDTQGPPQTTTTKTVMPEAKNKEGISDDLNIKEFGPDAKVTVSGGETKTYKAKPFNKEAYKAAEEKLKYQELQGTTSFVKDPVTGEGATIKQTSKSMTKQQAMEFLANNSARYGSMIDQINEYIRFAFQDGKPMPNINELPFMRPGSMPRASKGEEEKQKMFIDAVHTVYPELIQKLYQSKTKDGKFNTSDLLRDLNDPEGQADLQKAGAGYTEADKSTVALDSFNPIFNEVKGVGLNARIKNRELEKANESQSGNAVMNSSAAAEAAKSKESSNVVINAPSSTVNAPKSSNMVMPENIRNNETSMSRYIDSLSGVNI